MRSIFLALASIGVTACEAGPFEGDVISDTTQQFSFITPLTGSYSAVAVNTRTLALDLSLGSSLLIASGTPTWTDCAALGSTPWYSGSFVATIPNITSVQSGCATSQCFPWEYFLPGATSTNSMLLQVQGLSPVQGSFALTNFSANPNPNQTLVQCISQFQCSTQMISACSTGVSGLTVQTPCGGNGQHCCISGTAAPATCPGDSAAFCDFDLICREGLWPSALASTQAYRKNSSEDWNDEIQGLATDGTFWYLAKGSDSDTDERGTLFKQPMAGWDLGSTTNGVPTGLAGMTRDDDPQFTVATEHCRHWGDPEVFKGQVYVPWEDCSDPAGHFDPDNGVTSPNKLALFDATKLSGSTASTSSYIGAYVFQGGNTSTTTGMGFNCAPDATHPRSRGFPNGNTDCSAHMQSPTVAVHPVTGEIYVAGPQIASTAYSVYVLRADSHPITAKLFHNLKLVRVLPLDGNPPWASQANSRFPGTVPAGAAPIGYCSWWTGSMHNCGVQGMAFDPSGEKLYVVDQNQGPFAMANTIGTLVNGSDQAMANQTAFIHVYQVTPDHLVWEKDYPLDVNYRDHNEAEGIAILDARITTDSGAVSRSQVHTIEHHISTVGGHEIWTNNYAISGGPF